MKIQGLAIYAEEGKKIARAKQSLFADDYGSAFTLMSGETEKDFVEVAIADLPKIDSSEREKYYPKDEEIQAELNARLREKEEQTIRTEFDTLSDKEALKVKAFAPAWIDKVGKPVKAGERYYYDGKLWKVRQNHSVQANYPPSIDTASLYEEVNEGHEGTLADPIPYNNNMALESGKYYSQNGVTYKCTRDTGNPVYNDLKDLVGIYVEVTTE